ncbi:hypothetical protein GOV12_07695 [Candidatus Pacearchaeota archaeon]|nr:hypothetical protein [Candidatus Pacearchaeota archaeon]
MLNKINKIKNVGKFSNCTPSNITLSRDILVYARNTQGKSTFTAILHSLKENNPEILIGRKSIVSAGSQEIVIELGGETYCFSNNLWNKNFKNIEIFDTKFISDNISHVEQITSEQQKNLNQIILGEEGKKINDEIVNITTQITTNGTKKAELTKSLKEIGIVKSFEDLKNMQKINEVDLELEKIYKKLDQIKSKEEINKIKEKFQEFSLSPEELSLMSKKFELDNQIIADHISASYPSNNKNLDSSFVDKGLKLSQNGRCAFCGSEFIGKIVDLITNYQTIFSSEYKKHQMELNDLKKKIESYNFHSWSRIASELSSKGIQIIPPDTKQLEILKKEIINLIEEKLCDFNKSYEDIPALITILEIQKKFSDKLEKINLEILSSKKLETQKLEFELNKQVFSQVMQQKLSDYEKLIKNNEELENKRKSLQDDLNKYCNGICINYKNEVNQVLEQIHSNFKLGNLQHLKKLKGNDDSIFDIELNGCLISIYESDNSKPNFKNTLSESDKKALAFAFFIVKLRTDPNLDKKIIIFDDPISSFDRERKLKTAELILGLKNDQGKRPLQKIILTHEDIFLIDIYKKSKVLNCEFQLLKIISGDLCSCNFEEEFSERVLKDLKYLCKLKENYNGQDFDKEARIVLENIFKRKYYLKVIEIKKTLPSASIRSFVQGIYSQEDPRYSNGISLCDSLNIELHDNPERELSDGDKEDILQDFFNFLEII